MFGRETFTCNNVSLVRMPRQLFFICMHFNHLFSGKFVHSTGILDKEDGISQKYFYSDVRPVIIGL